MEEQLPHQRQKVLDSEKTASENNSHKNISNNRNNNSHNVNIVICNYLYYCALMSKKIKRNTRVQEKKTTK